jgi:hypothetical protein
MGFAQGDLLASEPKQTESEQGIALNIFDWVLAFTHGTHSW